MTLVSLGLALVLLAVIAVDMRLMRIPDALSAIPWVLFVVHVVLVGPGTWVLWQVGFAAIVFALGVLAFALNLMGGGDTKVLPGLALFVPLSALPAVMLTFAVALLVSIAAILLARRVAARPDHDWAVLREPDLPMGIPIGLAGLVLLVAAHFT